MNRIDRKDLAPTHRGFRFGDYEVDLQAGELRKHGIRLKLQEQPFLILSLLLARRGEVVTRDEIRQQLWADNSYVDFENGLNSAVSRLREALGDSASSPRFIETLPRRGYRFIAAAEYLGQAPAPTGDLPVAETGSPRPWIRNAVAGLLVAGLSMVAVWLWWTHAKPETPFESSPLTAYLGEELFPTFSPAGDEIAFSWDGEGQDNYDIYRKAIGPGESLLRLTTNPDRDYSPAWSPDGRWIAFLRGRKSDEAQVIVVPALGGPEREVGTVNPPNLGPVHPPSGYLAWTSDSRGLVVSDHGVESNQPGLFLLTIDTAQKRRLTTGNDVGPTLSPDARFLAFSRTVGRLVSDICVLPLADGIAPTQEIRCVNGDVRESASPSWTVDGKEIIFVGTRDGTRTLWRVSASGSAQPERLSIGQDAILPVISRRGNRIAYSHQRDRRWNIWRFDHPQRREEPFGQIASTGGESSPRFSPDGSKIAFSSRRSGLPQIWVSNSDGGELTQLTFFERGLAGSPRWSPDGTQLAFDSTANGKADVYTVRATGGEPKRLTDHPAADLVPSWSRDGEWVYFCSDRSGTRQIWKMPSSGGQPVQVTANGGFISQESVDGKILYYAKGADPGFGLWALPLSGGSERPLVERVFRRDFVITAGGVYFLATEDPRKTSIEYLDFTTGKTLRIADLEGQIGLGFSVSPDAKTFLYGRSAKPEADLVLIGNFR